MVASVDFFLVSLQGLADTFYEAKQLLPETFKRSCEESDYPLNLRMHEVSSMEFYCHLIFFRLLKPFKVIFHITYEEN